METILESKKFRFSWTKIEYLECEFNDVMHEASVEVKLDTDYL